MEGWPACRMDGNEMIVEEKGMRYMEIRISYLKTAEGHGRSTRAASERAGKRMNDTRHDDDA